MTEHADHRPDPSASYFERLGESSYLPTAHAGGVWDPEELHVSPLIGLLVHAIERHRAVGPGASLLLGRVGVDILGRLALDRCDIRVETIRPGRTIELVEAVASIAGRAVVVARAWYLLALDTSEVAGGTAPPLPGPETVAPTSMSGTWPGGYVASLDVRPVRPPEPGRAAAWLSGARLVAGEEASPVASFLALVDTANGIGPRQPPTRWTFPNVDLTVHLHRRPRGEWVGLETTQVLGPSGQGVTSTVLHDVDGPVGHAQQLLTVRPVVR